MIAYPPNGFVLRFGAALFFAAGALQAQVQVKTLIEEPVPDTVEPKVTVLTLAIPAGTGKGAPAHQHAGPVFAYLLEGAIENQVDPDPAKTFHPGGFFYEPTMQVHRMLRNLSATEPAKLLVFQIGDTGRQAPAIKPLMQEPLSPGSNRLASLITLTVSPGAVSEPHKHPGSVFGYVAKGEIENQVDPEPAKTYHAGDVFYEPPLHVHRRLRNLGKTEPAEVIVFQVREAGQPSTLSAK
ncbi:MAG TPA: cupin domain-containing protein [Bryobacteraceae bacterium]